MTAPESTDGTVVPETFPGVGAAENLTRVVRAYLGPRAIVVTMP